MKSKRKLFVLILASLLACSMLLGCISVPEEYTKGVKLDRDYPEDDMPIMDDAIVFSCEESDTSITIEYGVDDDLDDVVDFYKDHFDDNDIALEDESDKSSKYSAEGYYMNFAFDLRVSEPSGEYEEKQFETVVLIEIVWGEESLGSVNDLLLSVKSQIVGFWRQESFDSGSGKISSYEQGHAYEFTADGKINVYQDFLYAGVGAWSEVDSNTIQLTSMSGFEENATVTFEKRSGIDYLILKDSTGTLVFFFDSLDKLMTEDDDAAALSSDDKLSAAISGVTWHYLYYSDVDGQIISSSSGSIDYRSDTTFTDIFNDTTLTGNWYVLDSVLHCIYADGSDSSWPIEFRNRGGINYLYYYSYEEPAFWLYSDDPDAQGTDIQAENTTFTTDEDMAFYISDVTWRDVYYQYADGSTEPMTPNTLVFYSDGKLDDTYDGVYSAGTWYIQEGYLYMEYPDDDNYYYYPIYIEYIASSDAYYLYFGDLEVGYEGCNWVFSTFES